MGKKKLSTEAYKGVRDFYPEDQAILQYMIRVQREVLQSYGYEEYHASVLEYAELYKGKTSEEIVSEQTYTFLDRGQREVTLRPEMTPTIARMVAATYRELGFPLRLYSIPNVFRYERQQRGRLREHWQLNVDLFGSESLGADTEIIAIAHTLLRKFGAAQHDFTIHIGSRVFLNALIKEADLSEERGRLLLSHIDHHGKIPEEEFNEGLHTFGISADKLETKELPQDVADILSGLQDMGITNAVFDPYIVRGFAYYTGAVFEIFDTSPENNRSIFGGGRYDNLIGLFSDEEVAGTGFGMGDVTLRDFLATHNLLPAYLPSCRAYIAVLSPSLVPQAQALATYLREQHINVAIDFGEKKLAEQLKTASKHRIPFVIMLGEDEIRDEVYTLRDMHSGEQRKASKEELAGLLQ